MKIITNTSPIIGLYDVFSMDGLKLLTSLYSDISTSNYVYDKEMLYPEELVHFKKKFIIKRTPSKSALERLLEEFNGNIQLGEITCAALYLDGGYEELLMEDEKAERAFLDKGIVVRNVLELSYLAIRNDVLDEKEARIFVAGMTREFRPSQRIVEKFKVEGFGFLLEP